MVAIPTPISPPTPLAQWRIVRLMQQEMQIGEKRKTFERAERAPGVRVILKDPNGKICITHEYRSELHNGEGWDDYRLPWGKVFDTLTKYLAYSDTDEDISTIWTAAREAVQIEMAEELGIEVKHAEPIHISSCGATMRRDLHYYLVDEYSHVEWWQSLGEWERIQIGRYTPGEVIRLCLDGHISEDRSVAVLLRLLVK